MCTLILFTNNFVQSDTFQNNLMYTIQRDYLCVQVLLVILQQKQLDVRGTSF